LLLEVWWALVLERSARQMERVREGYDEKEKIARGELYHRGQFSCAGLAARRCNFPLTTLPCRVIESSPRANNTVPRRSLAYTSLVSNQPGTPECFMYSRAEAGLAGSFDKRLLISFAIFLQLTTKVLFGEGAQDLTEVNTEVIPGREFNLGSKIVPN